MTKNRTSPIALFFLIFIFFSCNPDCDSLVGIQLSTQITQSGHQVMITADPPSSLNGRRIFFNDTEVESAFSDGNGLIVTVPENMEGAVELRVEDQDCVDFIAFEFDVESEEFFENNPDYIFPSIPEIIIPNLPTDFPPSIENAWLHPIKTDYCFWFKFLPDTSGHCTKFIDPLRSFEKSICDTEGLLYSFNPLDGRVEADGSVFVTVNRPGGAEEFRGKLISAMDVPEKYRKWEDLDCPGVFESETWANTYKNREFMMLLTSQLTGRQLVIYQQVGIPDVSIDCP